MVGEVISRFFGRFSFTYGWTKPEAVGRMRGTTAQPIDAEPPSNALTIAAKCYEVAGTDAMHMQ